MKINYVPSPMMQETHLFAEFPLAAVKEVKEVWVDLSLQTKTRLSISLRSTVYSVGANFIPPGSENLKFHAETSMSYFSGNRSTRQYFVISRKQSIAALEQHIKNLVAQVFSIEQSEDFTINVYTNAALRQVYAAGVNKDKIAA